MTANEIRAWHNTVPANITSTLFQSMVLEEIAAQLAEQNDCNRAIVQLWGDAKKRDEDNIARIAKLDEDLQKARIATEEIAQKYWQLAAKVEEAKADLWKPFTAAPRVPQEEEKQP